MSQTNNFRIAVTVDPEIPVPPELYGGIERIVDMLVRGLIERGHDVTLFAHPESVTPARLEPYPRLRSRAPVDLVKNLTHVSSGLLKSDFDVIHSFARLAYLLPILPKSMPKIMSYQRGITARSVAWGNKLSRGTLHFTGCSKHQIRDYANRSNWHVIYNGVSTTAYQFRDAVPPEAPLVFLGRIEKIKGPHVAIRVAKRSKRKLILVGNIPESAEHKGFFDKEIKPHLGNGSISYFGPANDQQKNELLGQAAALLFPIQWDEPFGIVMVEALACGTPVIAYARGSAPEVIEHGVNGYLCDSVEQMIESVQQVTRLDRSACRKTMEERFSDDAIVSDYLALYRALISKSRVQNASS